MTLLMKLLDKVIIINKRYWSSCLIPFLVLLFILVIKYFEITKLTTNANIEFVAILNDVEKITSSVVAFFSPYSFNGLIHWTSTGIGFVFLLNKILSYNHIYFILISLLFFVSYSTTLHLKKDIYFSVIYSFLMVSSYTFFLVYSYGCALFLILFLIYMQLNFFSYYMIFFEERKNRYYYILFYFSLILLMLCWESWVNYFVFLILISLIKSIRDKKIKKDFFYSKFNWILILFFVLYLLARFSYIGSLRELATTGSEDDFIFTYSNIIFAFEDFFSNLIKYTYTAITHFIPSLTLSTFILSNYNSASIIEEYSTWAMLSTKMYLYNYIFTWYLYAGIVFAIYVYYMMKKIVSYLKGEENNHLLLISLLILFFGSWVHLFIKFRAYLSFPYYFGYKQIVSIMGVSLIYTLIIHNYFVSILNRSKFLAQVFLVVIILLFTFFSYQKIRYAYKTQPLYDSVNIVNKELIK